MSDDDGGSPVLNPGETTKIRDNAPCNVEETIIMSQDGLSDLERFQYIKQVVAPLTPSHNTLSTKETLVITPHARLSDLGVVTKLEQQVRFMLREKPK